jgi:hypothetical protein
MRNFLILFCVFLLIGCVDTQQRIIEDNINANIIEKSPTEKLLLSNVTLIFGDNFTMPISFNLNESRHMRSLEVSSQPKELRILESIEHLRVRQYVGLAAASGGPWAEQLSPIAATGWKYIKCFKGRCLLPDDIQGFPSLEVYAKSTSQGSLRTLKNLNLEWFDHKTGEALAGCANPLKMNDRICYFYNSRLEIEIRYEETTTLIVLERAGGA